MDRFLHGGTKPLLDLSECEIVGALVRIVRDIMHGDVWNDVQHELRKLLNLVVHALIADVEYLARDGFGLGLEPTYKDVDDVLNVNEWAPLLSAAHHIDYTVLPGAKRHDVNCEIETHTRR